MKTRIPARMPAAEKAVWLAALRSGEYKQGRMAMKNPDGSFCCLGVAQQALTGTVETCLLPIAGAAGPLAVPSPEWAKEHGWSDSNFFLPSIQCRCSEANDYHKMSFARIAAAIEIDVEGY
jgi:hypothetical protein